MTDEEELAARIRDLLEGDPDISEKRMFGSQAFLSGGHLAVAASGRGGLMVRVEPEETEALVAQAGVERMVMQGRALDGWLRVDDAVVTGDAELEDWVERGVAYARSLPPKG